MRAVIRKQRHFLKDLQQKKVTRKQIKTRISQEELDAVIYACYYVLNSKITIATDKLDQLEKKRKLTPLLSVITGKEKLKSLIAATPEIKTDFLLNYYQLMPLILSAYFKATTASVTDERKVKSPGKSTH